jgi:hypothetical protein
MFSCKISSCKSAGRFNVQPGTTADKITDVEANKQKPTSVPLSPEPVCRLKLKNLLKMGQDNVLPALHKNPILWAVFSFFYFKLCLTCHK